MGTGVGRSLDDNRGLLDSWSMVGRQGFTGYAAALRRLLGVAALLGLFAMHGLASHGTAHAGHAAEPMGLTAATAPAHPGHGTTTATQPETSRMSSAPDDPAPDPGLLGLAGLCLAVLLIGVIVAVLLGRGVVLPRKLDAAQRAGGWSARARRDRDPPCLFALSIQRC